MILTSETTVESVKDSVSWPNFFIAGSAKSGTTSLHEYLDQHPDIFMSKVKEPQFFIWNGVATQDLIEYTNLFKEGTNKLVRGESSTGYMVFPGVVERIKERIDNPKFVFVLRNPVDRAYSHYWWMKGLGFEKNDFETAFLKDMEKLPDPKNSFTGNYKYYFQYGCYSKWIRQYTDVFGIQNVLILTTEQLKLDPLKSVNICSEFLGLPVIDDIKEVVSNKTGVIKYARAYWWFRKALRNKRFNSYVNMLSSDFLSEGLKSLKCKTEQARSGFLFNPQPYPSMSLKQRKWVSSFYKHDVSKLREFTLIDFFEWNDDFHDG